ncbi:TatD family hydrolase [Methanococcus voltae]|uniref:TatD-related deoxyribonuclease n=2 Tax=Methanococcus voltae TaxID=2188 RepID=A0A8J7RGU6_METVO|nr:TatD family hydrolase [Methanococcus voltae]MBP2172456.1 TatD-related deoxyribonuclease [Methanococcus voltae]MBP2201637.1 TatD-related deoxyribonuclease [Methanococcus voltae]MCS3922425.1 TatD-related deoxyribonuclease [Methanococcus voltae PS]
MEILKNLPITDNHIHIDEKNGMGSVKVAQVFEKAGGKTMIIPNKPAFSLELEKPIDELLLSLQRIEEETNVKAFGMAGVHPVEFINFVRNGMSIEEAKNRVIQALDYCQKIVMENDNIVGIGEIGRPHFELTGDDAEILWATSNELFTYSMALAKDADCAIQIHAESASDAQFKEFSEMAKSVGLNPEKVIKHHCDNRVNEGIKYGIMPSIVASSPCDEAIAISDRFLMETDYIDDLKRPGVVLGIKTVPRRTRKLLQNGLMTEEMCYNIHKNNVEKCYNIEIDF